MAQRPPSRPAGGDSPRGNWRTPGRKAPVKRDTPLYGRSETSHSGLWWKRVLSLLLVFVLVLVFIAVIRWIPRSTPLIVMTVTDYAAPAPPNGWAKEDAAALRASWPLNGAWKDYWNNIRVEVAEKSASTGDLFIETALEMLRAQPAGGPQKNVRVLYLSAHGVVNSSGEPCLLLANPRDDQATKIWPGANAELPLVSLPQLIGKLRDEAKQNRGAKFVVLLESNRIDSDWRLGVLENNFASSLTKYMNENATPGDNSVVLINSASPGEVAQAYPEYGASGFGMFARAGLLGAADTDNDRKVELHELRDYLRKNVDVLAQQGRYRTQQPQLLPTDAADFAVAYAQDRNVDPLAGTSGVTAEALQEKWSSTYSLWQKHTQLTHYHDDLNDAREVTALHLPSLVALEQGLLRLDQLCDAGSAYSSEFQALEASLQRLTGQLLEVAKTQSSLPRTLPAASGANDAQAGSPGPAIPEFEMLRTIVAGGEEKAAALEKWKALPLATQQYYLFHWLASEPEPSFDAGLALLTAPATPLMLAKEPVGIRSLRRFRADGSLPTAVGGNRSLLQKVLDLRSTIDLFADGAGDLRAQYVAIPYVLSADAARRDGEDRLFTGDIPGVDAALAKATSSYQGDIHDSRNIASWYALRDTVWMEVPYYAQWSLTLQRETTNGSAEQAEANALVDHVRRAIELSARLTQGLEWLTEAVRGQSDTTDVGALTKQINALGGDVLLQRLTLRRAFQTAMQECNTGAYDRANLADVLRVLRVPLSSPARQSLRERYLQILTKQRAPSLVKVIEDEKAASTKGNLIQPANLSEIAKLGVHPGEQLWRACKRLPVAISSLKLDELSTTWEPAKPSNTTPSVAATAVATQLGLVRDVEPTAPRNTLSGADQKSRLVLPFATLPGNFDEAETGLGHPQQKLLDCDRHHYLVLQAERTLDDFWGAADAPATAAHQGDYFALVTDDYLQEAGRLYSNQSEPLRAAQQKLALRKQASQQLLQEIARANIAGTPIEGTQTFERTINWLDSDLKGRVNGLPAGQAALYTITNTGARGSILLRQSGAGEFQPEIAQPIAASGASSAVLPPKLDFQFGNDAGADSSFDLVFYYRSHGERQLVGVGKLVPGPLTVWEKPPSQRPQVVVQGDAGPEPNVGSVAILLDCSHSMEAKFGGKETRMQVALNALRDITDELQRNGQKDFTIWLFGHRRYVPTDAEFKTPQFKLGPNRYATPFNPAFGADDPTVHFHNDVQQVWPAEKAPPLHSLLNPETLTIRPWGRTPLYNAMYQAIAKDLAKRDKAAPRRMIVLSDGDNFTRAPEDAQLTYVPKWEYDAKDDKSATDLIKALKDDFGENFAQRIELHVVDLTNGGATAIRDDKVVETVKGTFHPAGNLDELKRVLKQAAGLYQYAIYDDSRQEYVARNVPLGVIKEIDNYAGHQFSVRLEGTSATKESHFELAGGEKLTFGIKHEDGQPRVVPVRPRFEESAAQTVANPIRTTNDDDFFPKEFRVVLVVPQRVGAGDVEFRIAVQNQMAERFSPRPKAAWIVIEPGNTVEGTWTPAGEEYIFSDLTFQFDQPVPVLRQVARAWPRSAKEARVQAWFSLQDWPSLTGEPLRKVRVSSADEEENFKWKPAGVPDNLRCAVQINPRPEGGAYVIVTQLTDGTTPPALRVKLSREPDVIRRQYYRAPHAGRVQHVFEYRTASPDALLEEFLDIQTLDKLKPLAAHLKEPVVIRVPEN